MPVNPAKIRCSHPGCRGWAMRESAPPLCSIHAGRTFNSTPGQAAGAPRGNDNHLLHGFYSRFLRDADGQPIVGADGTRLEGEIAITRVALHRVLTMLVTGSNLGSRPRPLNTTDIARLVGLAFEGARTVSRLIEVRYNLGADREDEYLVPIDQILDELGAAWGIEL